jgi:hypothetical protein
MTTRQHVCTWRTRPLVLFICAQPDDPTGPQAECRPTPRMVRGSCLYSPSPRLLSPPGGFRLRWTRCRAVPQLLEPSWLQLRHWGGGGPAEGCRVAAGSSGTILCVPIEFFQLVAAKQSSFSTKVVEYLPVLEDSMTRTTAGCRGLHPRLTVPA